MGGKKSTEKKTSGKKPARMLTETELELMQILWSLGEGTVNEVLECLPKERKLAYTSVSTILRILEQKGSLSARKEGRGHVYVPTIRRADYEAKSVHHLIDRVFAGAPVSLVRQLVSTGRLSADDLEEIKKLIERHGDGR